MLTPTTQPTPASAVLVLGAFDTLAAGTAALSVPGVACVTADPERRQVLVRYDPREVEADSIRRAVRPLGDASGTRLWLNAWPTLAKALPAAASLL